MTETPIALIDVLVCTYRRPDLLIKTLDGIARSAATVDGVRIVVVDNDSVQSARDVTQQWARQHGIPVQYLLQPLQNISLTRNIALKNATAPWIALIDDDEVADENWLSSLLSTAAQFNADVVFGPVIAEFNSSAPAWATNGTLFQRKRFPSGTDIPLREMRTGNVLLRNAPLIQDSFLFDPELGLSGGEDSHFFELLVRAKYKMVWCDQACVREWTPDSRTKVSWLMRRAFRVGSVDAYNKRRFRHMRAVGLGAIKSCIFVAQGGLLSLLWAPISLERCLKAMQRTAIGAGYFYGLFNGPYNEYRSTNVLSGA